jgi:GxxExxY protein
MAIELRNLGLVVQTELALPVTFRGSSVGDFRADIVVNNAVLLELKAVEALDRNHYAQVMNYLKATRMEIGLLLNFGRRPAVKRFLFENSLKQIRLDPCESVLRV